MAPPRSESTSKSGRSSRCKNWEKCLTVVIFLQSISIIAVLEKHQLQNVKEMLKYGQEEIKATNDTKHRQYQYRDDDPNNGLNNNAIDGGRQERPLSVLFFSMPADKRWQYSPT